MRTNLKNERGFWGLLGLVLSLVITMLMFSWAAKVYFPTAEESPSSAASAAKASSKRTRAAAAQAPESYSPPQEVTYGSYRSILKDTTDRIHAVERQGQEREDQLLEAVQGMAGGNR